MTIQVTPKKVNTTLTLVSLIYFILIVPIVPVEFNLLQSLGLEKAAFWSHVFYSAYWWIYAVNFIIYVATMKNYRKIYLVFLRDMALVAGARQLASHPKLDYLPQKCVWTLKS